jgi:hypothetical protein
MLRRIVERDGIIEVPPAFGDLGCMQEGHTREAMPNHLRSSCFSLVGQG